MKCARVGCRKDAHPVDPHCSRECATRDHTGQDHIASSAGSLLVGRGQGQALGGKPIPLTACQHEAAQRDREARERVDGEQARRERARLVRTGRWTP